MLWGGNETLPNQLMLVIGLEAIQQPWEFHGAEIVVYLGDFFLQLILVPLAETARNVELFNLPTTFSISVVKDGIDAFFLGQVNETTGVDDDDIGLLVTIVADFIIVSL